MVGKLPAERLAFHVLHGHEDNLVDLVHLVNAGNVGMCDSCRSLRLAQEPATPFRVFREVGGEDLQRHLAAQPRVLGLVNDTHPAFAELPEDLVVRESATDLYRTRPQGSGYVGGIEGIRGVVFAHASPLRSGLGGRIWDSITCPEA